MVVVRRLVLSALTGSREAAIVIAILICGALGRLVVTSGVTTPYRFEVYNVEASLVTTGRFADPFGYPSGPTAHLGMLTPLPSALAYWLFGVGAPRAEYFLTLWSVVLICLSIWLCWLLAVALEAPRYGRVAAVAVAALAPLYLSIEVRFGRNYEGPLATVILIWILLKMAQADAGVLSRGWLVLMGASTGFLFIWSPPAGLAAILSLVLFHLLRAPLRQWWIAPASALAVAGLLAGPWAVRNSFELGSPIFLRDNLGLELAIANYPGAVHPADPRLAHVARLKEIQTMFVTEAGLRAAGGEVAYYDALGQTAWEWIGSHPRDFSTLCERRFVEFFLPPRWFWSPQSATPERHSGLRQAIVWLAALGGLATLVAMAPFRRAYAYVLVAVVGYSLVYVLVYPGLRYRYPISTLLIFCAFDGSVRLFAYLRARNLSRLSPDASAVDRPKISPRQA
ncbi:MAG TPA: hypothetical protein VF886_08905 [Roseiarcus sp.]